MDEDELYDDGFLLEADAHPSSSQSRTKKGVIYISRIPPHMKPQKLRQMLEQYGEIGRLYLAPEAPSMREKRKKHKGNTGKNFTEGWVEFLDKRIAKQAAAMLNGQPMGGRKRSAYHFDLWCLKYLPKFKWEALTEEIAYQRALHDQKLATELSAAKRERDFYLSRVDKAKGIAAIKKRKAEQAATEPSEEDKPPTAAAAPEASQPQKIRAYGQRKPKSESVQPGALPSDLLSLIAGKPQSGS